MQSRLRLVLLWVCATTLLVVSTPAQAEASCGLRMRRAWSSLSSSEQMLYKNALAASMDSGAYIKFIEMHTEMMSTTEAHKSCMFIYWHRLFLTVFENMLRDQGPQFACITVPYWDWISDYNRFVNRECTNMLSCSSALQALGGVTGSQKVYLKINGVQTSGNCSTSFPLNHFCHAANVAGSQCVRCVTRGPWGSRFLPASASYASVRSQLFAAKDINDMSTAIETGVHNSVHAALDGAMSTFASPADPIFWSHHAMVDLLHTIFHKCRVGEQMMTLAEKVASPTGWNSCKRQNGTSFSPYDAVVMRTGAYGVNPILGSQDSMIGKYFGDLPTQFAALMDHNDLGSSSYMYLYQGLLGELYNKCGNSTTSPATVPAPAPPPTDPPTAPPVVLPPASPSPAPTTKAPVATPTPAPTTKAPVATPTPAPTTKAPVATPTPALTTKAPTPAPTPAPTTKAPASAPQTVAPAVVTPPQTPAPTTKAPATAQQTTTASVTASPPQTQAPTPVPTSPAPIQPSTGAPTSPAPTTRAPTPSPTSAPPASPVPTPAQTTKAPLILIISSPTPPTPAPTTVAPVALPFQVPAPTTGVSTAFANAANASSASPISTITTVQQQQRKHHHRRLDDPETSSLDAVVIVAAVNTTLDASAQKVSTFISRTDEFLEARFGEDVDQVDEQEKMACMFQDECLGGVRDYSEQFKRDFRVYGKPRCKRIVDRIRSGVDNIGLSYWKDTMTKSFGCPIPTQPQPVS